MSAAAPVSGSSARRVIPASSVRRVAEILLETPHAFQSPSVPEYLAVVTETRVREVLQKALKLMRMSKREKLTVDDVARVIRARDGLQILGVGAGDGARTFRPPDARAVSVAEESVVTLSDVIATPIAPLPLEPAVTAHWLAVNGVQPAIPQNPVVTRLRRRPPPAEVPAGVEIRPEEQHVLGKELQLYFDMVCKAVQGEVVSEKASEVLEAALDSLATDQGLVELVPYFVQFAADEIARNLSDLSRLNAVMRMVRALLRNSRLNLEFYIHQILPAVLTCVIGKQLGDHPMDDHWSLRGLAAKTLAAICRQYGVNYPVVQTRVCSALLGVLVDPRKPIPSHYGAIAGLTALGPSIVNRLLLPIVVQFHANLIKAGESTLPARAHEAEQCLDALRRAVGLVIVTQRAQGAIAEPLTLDYETLKGIFGESLPLYSGEQANPTSSVAL